MTKPIHLLIII